MSSSGHKKSNKPKPPRLSEYFHTPSAQPTTLETEPTYSSVSPISSVMAESMDQTSQGHVVPPPLTEQSLQHLFESFRHHLQTDFKSMMAEFKNDIQALVSRTEHVEKKMSEFTKSHNALLDSHATLEEEVARLTAKTLDLEDRSRRNNIRLRGIPESVPPDQLRPFLIDFMTLVLPNCTQLDFTIDRIHRIPKPKNIPPQSPRDTLARIHFFHIKDQFLRDIKAVANLPDRFQQISIYPDLSAATMMRRKEFAPFTKVLRDHDIRYRWGFPVKLIIYKDGNTSICQTPAALKDCLSQWNLLSTPTNSPPRKRPTMPQAITPLWSEKHSKS